MFDAGTHSPIPVPVESAASSPAPSKRQKLSDPSPSASSKKSITSPNADAKLSTRRVTAPTPDLHPLWTSSEQRKHRMLYSKLQQHQGYLSESSAPRSLSPASSLLGNSQASSTATEATSVEDLSAPSAIKTETPSEPDSELSELSVRFDLDDTAQRIVRRRKQRGLAPTRQSARHKSAVPTIERSASPCPSDSDSDSSGSSTSANDEPRPRPRRPGDYTLTRALLTTAYSRWVECRNCPVVFVQEDAYQTRAACPRCERHSKLYGFAWPKTDREGKADKEERVLDHRLVHRFVPPEEERLERKGRAGGVIAETGRGRGS